MAGGGVLPGGQLRSGAVASWTAYTAYCSTGSYTSCSPRAGGFEPLRFLPKGDKRVVLGLVTSKFGEMEDKDAIKRRLDRAARYADMDQLCPSPQCGFASTEEATS